MMTELESVSIDNISGKTITRVYYNGNVVDWSECTTKVPDASHLSNFDLKFGSTTLLVLDDYGNECMSHEFSSRILEADEPYTIAINRNTGVITKVTFGLVKDESSSGLAAFCSELPGYHRIYSEDFIVPTVYMKRLNELKTQKRPFALMVSESAWYDFLERETGYHELRNNLVVRLHFAKYDSIDVSYGTYRTVGAWNSYQSPSSPRKK